MGEGYERQKQSIFLAIPVACDISVHISVMLSFQFCECIESVDTLTHNVTYPFITWQFPLYTQPSYDLSERESVLIPIRVGMEP